MVARSKKPMMPTELKALAKAAFGPDWKVALAGPAGCSRETLWRYERGLTLIGPARAFTIRCVCHDKIQEHVAVLAKYPQAAAAAAVGMPRSRPAGPAAFDPRSIKTVGRKVLGRTWAAVIAKEVNVSTATIRNWVLGTTKMDADRVVEMKKLLGYLPDYKKHGLI